MRNIGDGGTCNGVVLLHVLLGHASVLLQRQQLSAPQQNVGSMHHHYGIACLIAL